MDNRQLSNNTLALIALCNEYCQTAEQAAELGHDDFIDATLRLLPRIYIAAGDITPSPDGADMFLQDALDEEYYDSVRRGIESAMGEDDTYLDVFEEDMKYSDTPISASIAEGCADLFQVFYNYIETVRDAPTPLVEEATETLRDDFGQYWARTLCNVLRAVNAVRHH